MAEHMSELPLAGQKPGRGIGERKPAMPLVQVPRRGGNGRFPGQLPQHDDSGTLSDH